MKELFKDLNEFREYVPWVYASGDFGRFRLDIELATEDLMEVVGKKIYERALKGLEDDANELDHELLERFRLPVALNAYLSFAQNADVSHEGDGRKVKIDKESESLPWQWMLDRDDAAIRAKAGKATDRLISFLDEHVNDLEEWKESEQRKDRDMLFVRNAAEFDEVVPIDRSRVFYLRVLPYIRQTDREMIKYLGKDRFISLKEAMKQGILDEEQEKLVELCKEVVPHLVMAKAVRRLAITVLPNSVVCHFESSSQTKNASTPASQESISALEEIYLTDAKKGTERLQEYLKEISSDGTMYTREETDYRHEKFFTV